MSKIHTFPKIFPVGSDFIPDLFKGEVEITEKIDGSQFGFGVTEQGEVVVRSKGKEMALDNPEKMFKAAVDYVISIEDKLKELPGKLGVPSISFYGEYLGSPSHNVLKYGRIPNNHIMIFGVMVGESFVKDHVALQGFAAMVGLETVPLIYRGEIQSYEELQKFMDTDSVLGVEKSEGIVIKNYLAPCILGNMVLPSMAKYVREDFKERHASDWGPKFSTPNKLEVYFSSFKSEARWHKAIQHLQEKGELTNSPKDIGKLLEEIERDIIEEEKENIMKELYKIFKDQILRKARQGFPEFYKAELAKRAFEL